MNLLVCQTAVIIVYNCSFMYVLTSDIVSVLSNSWFHRYGFTHSACLSAGFTDWCDSSSLQNCNYEINSTKSRYGIVILELHMISVICRYVSFCWNWPLWKLQKLIDVSALYQHCVACTKPKQCLSLKYKCKFISDL